jgi:hypothetical protein
MKLTQLAPMVAILTLGFGVANAQNDLRVNLVAYRGMDGPNYVVGSLTRTSNPGVWIETNTEGTATIQWREVSESPHGITFYDPTRSYSMRVSIAKNDVEVQKGATDTFHHLYDVAFSQ